MNEQEMIAKAKHDALQVGCGEDEICIREGIKLKIHPESRYPFEFFCWRSPEMVKEMDCFIKYAKGRKCLLDVGAHHGLFSLVFAEMNKKGKVYTFEPSFDPSDILRQNMQLNLYPQREYDYGCELSGLSDKDEWVTMHKEWDHLILGDGEGAVVIHTMRGDKFCTELSIVPDTLKLDCEGMEVKVLKGLSETIKKHKPIIFLEVHPDRMIKNGDTMMDLIQMIIDFGYKSVINTESESDVTLDQWISYKTGEHRLILLP